MNEEKKLIHSISCSCFEMAALLSGNIHRIRVPLTPKSQDITPGCLIWVKEIATPRRFQSVAGVGVWGNVSEESQTVQNCCYKVDNRVKALWKSSLSMPRWASRVTLQVTKTRPCRLQDVDEQSVFLEGVDYWVEYDQVSRGGDWWGEDMTRATRRGLVSMSHGSGLMAYRKIWNTMQAGKEFLTWDADPAMLEIDFKPKFENIGGLLKDGCENTDKQKAVQYCH